MEKMLVKKMLVISIFSFFPQCFPLPFPTQQILDSSKLKGFADDNFKFNKNGKKFSRRVESTQCFQKTCTADTLKQGLVWERVKPISLYCENLVLWINPLPDDKNFRLAQIETNCR